MNKKEEKLGLENSAKEIIKAIEDDCGCEETREDVFDFLENRKSSLASTMSKLSYWQLLNNRASTCDKIMENFEHAGMKSQLFKCIDPRMQQYLELSTFTLVGLALYKPKSYTVKGVAAMSLIYVKTFFAAPLLMENHFRRHAMIGRDLVSQELRNLYEYHDSENPFIPEMQ